MSAKELVSLAYDRRLFSDRLAGKTPHQTMKAKLSVHIRRHGDLSPFVRTRPGRFYLRRLLTDPGGAYYARPAHPLSQPERVLVFPAKWLDKARRFQGITRSWKRFHRHLFKSSVGQYIERLKAEHDETFKQVLTYILVTRRSQVLAYQRGTFSRVEDFLKGSHCIGFGGHVSESDLTLFSPSDFGLLDSAARELSEELTLPAPDKQRLKRGDALQIIGLINDDSSSVGRRHFAFVLRYEVSDSPAWDRPERGEKSVTQLRWLDPASPGLSLNDFEYWSQLCFRSYLPKLVRAQASFVIRRKHTLSPPHVLCVVGALGSGKSEATRVLTRHFGYREVNSGRVLASLLGLAPVRDTGRNREAFQARSWKFISRKDGPRRLAASIWREAQRLTGPRILVDGIRQRATLAHLRELADPLRVSVLFVHTPPDVAYRFYKVRSPKSFTIHDFLRVRDAPVEREVNQMIGQSDAVLYNWQGRNMYRHAVLHLMQAAGVQP